MTDEPSKRDERAERLAAALRENLRRRKAQARGQAGTCAGQDERAGSQRQTTNDPST